MPILSHLACPFAVDLILWGYFLAHINLTVRGSFCGRVPGGAARASEYGSGSEQDDRPRGGWRGRNRGDRGEGGRGEHRGSRGRSNWRGRNDGYGGGEHCGCGEGRGGGGKVSSKSEGCSLMCDRLPQSAY